MSRETNVLVSLLVLAALVSGVYVTFGAGGEDEYRPGLERPSFEEVARDRGLDYATNATGLENGGVFVTDFDGDRWPDLLVTGGGRPVLFENAGGSFEPSGVLPPVSGTVDTALFFDHDNDGREDLLLLRAHATPVFLENVGGEFERRAAGFRTELATPRSAAAADYDGDGCLDVFVVQNADWNEFTPMAAKPGHNETTDRGDNGRPNYLYRGDCSSFERVDGAGIRGNHWSLATSFVDFTGDGRPDIHVGNDFYHDVVYVNRGDGTFDRSVLGGATDRNAMSSETADVDGDGDLDVFVTNIYLPPLLTERKPPLRRRARGNNLLINRGNGTFVDRADAYGVRKGGWGWAAAFADLDNDMDRDLVHTTDVVDIPPMMRALQRKGYNSFEAYEESHPYLAYPVVRERNGSTFEAREASGLGFGETRGTGLVRLDYDRDGDLDLAMAQSSGPVKLYENVLGKGNAVRVAVESAPGRPAAGARVTLTVDGRTGLRVRNAKADFLSQDSRVLHFGVGGHATVEAVRVAWPDGTEVVVEDVPADRRVVVAPDGNTSVVPVPGAP